MMADTDEKINEYIEKSLNYCAYRESSIMNRNRATNRKNILFMFTHTFNSSHALTTELIEECILCSIAIQYSITSIPFIFFCNQVIKSRHSVNVAKQSCLSGFTTSNSFPVVSSSSLTELMA